MTTGEAAQVLRDQYGTERPIPGQAAAALARWVTGHEALPGGMSYHFPPRNPGEHRDMLAITIAGSIFVMIAEGEFANDGYGMVPPV